MSRTPLDESSAEGGNRRVSADSVDSTDSSPGARGILGRVLDVCRRIGSRLFGAFAPGASEPDQAARDDRAAEATVTHQIQRSTPLADREGTGNRPVVSNSRPSDAVSLERAQSPREPPELVASWGDGQLTLAEAGDPDTSISSDTWTDVDR